LIRGSAFLLNAKQMLDTKSRPNKADGKTLLTVFGLTPKYQISVNLRLPIVDEMKESALFIFNTHGGKTLQFYERQDNIIDVEFVNSAKELIPSHDAQCLLSQDAPEVVVETREMAQLRLSAKPLATIFECASNVLIPDSPAYFLNCISANMCPRGTSVQRICVAISKYMFACIHISLQPKYLICVSSYSTVVTQIFAVIKC